jgi:hypothetical protein
MVRGVIEKQPPWTGAIPLLAAETSDLYVREYEAQHEKDYLQGRYKKIHKFLFLCALQDEHTTGFLATNYRVLLQLTGKGYSQKFAGTEF